MNKWFGLPCLRILVSLCMSSCIQCLVCGWDRLSFSMVRSSRYLVCGRDRRCLFVNVITGLCTRNRARTCTRIATNTVRSLVCIATNTVPSSSLYSYRDEYSTVFVSLLVSRRIQYVYGLCLFVNIITDLGTRNCTRTCIRIATNKYSTVFDLWSSVAIDDTSLCIRWSSSLYLYRDEYSTVFGVYRDEYSTAVW